MNYRRSSALLLLPALATLSGCGTASSATQAVAIPPAAAASPAFPTDSGVLNVRDFGAVGDGKTDDTASILAAIAASGPDYGAYLWQDKIIYLPDGTYLLSAPLLKRYATGSFACGMILIGQSQSGTILKLKDNLPAYQSTTAPAAMVFTTSKLYDRSGPYGGGKDYPALGEGNDAYRNSIQNMTLNVGSGNPGAIGIDYLANNVGAIRNVTVTAPSGSGTTGIAMTRKWIGPALLEHVTVQGFNVGIDFGNTLVGAVLNHVTLNGQITAGLRNSQNAVSTNDLRINSVGPAIVTTAADGEIVLAQAQLNSQSATTVQNLLGTIVFHDSQSSNYKTFTSPTQSATLEGYRTGPATWTPIANFQFMPLTDPPTPPQDDTTKWVNVALYGASPVDHVDSTGAPSSTPVDALQAFNAAFATGASTLYLPHGVYYVSQPIVIPDTVRHIVGMNSTIRVYQTNGYVMNRAQGIFRTVPNSATAPSLQIENLTFDNINGGSQLAVEHTSPRTLILQDSFFIGVTMLTRGATGGPVYLADTNSGGRSTIAGTAPVTAVQLDTEGCNTICLTNPGVDLNILGMTSENIVTLVSATGGRTQVLGGWNATVVPDTTPAIPLFQVNNAILSASFVEDSASSTTHYTSFLSETFNGTTYLTPEAGYAPRDTSGYGRVVPFLQTINH